MKANKHQAWISAEDILRGLRNIDRMKKDIHDLVSVLRELLRITVKGPPSRIDIEINVDNLGADIKWKISGDLFEESDDRLTQEPIFESSFECWISNSLRYSSKIPYHSKDDQYELVHRSLSALVNGLTKKFPKLRDKLDLFINASRIKFSD